MFCCVYTDQWSADTGYICDDDQEQEIEALSNELKKLVESEVEAIINKESAEQSREIAREAEKQALELRDEAKRLRLLSIAQSMMVCYYSGLLLSGIGPGGLQEGLG